MIKKGIFSEISGGSQLSIFIIITIVSLLIFMFLGTAVTFLITGIGPNNSILSNFNNPETILYLKISQIFQAIGLFISPPLIAAYLFNKSDSNYLQLKSTKFIFILIAGFLMVSSLPIINWLAEMNQNISFPESLENIEEWIRNNEEHAANITKHFLKANSIGVLALNLFVMALIPAIGEELLFRGVLQKLFSKITNNIHLGIWITAFVFSAIHMQFLTFLPRFFMGALFGYMLVWSGSIWLPITAHFINNGMAVIMNYLVQNKSIDSEIENIGSNNNTYLLFSIIILGSILYFTFYNYYKRNSI